MSMSGEYIIQQSTMLRGQGHLLEAIACIEKHIHKISAELHATAWQEAHFAAVDLGDAELSDYYAKRAAEEDRKSKKAGLMRRPLIAEPEWSQTA